MKPPVLIPIIDANTVLPRCTHGNPLLDFAGTQLEPPCGCKAVNEQPNKRIEYHVYLRLNGKHCGQAKSHADAATFPSDIFRIDEMLITETVLNADIFAAGTA